MKNPSARTARERMMAAGCSCARRLMYAGAIAARRSALVSSALLALMACGQGRAQTPPSVCTHYCFYSNLSPVIDLVEDKHDRLFICLMKALPPQKVSRAWDVAGGTMQDGSDCGSDMATSGWREAAQEPRVSTDTGDLATIFGDAYIVRGVQEHCSPNFSAPYQLIRANGEPISFFLIEALPKERVVDTTNCGFAGGRPQSVREAFDQISLLHIAQASATHALIQVGPDHIIGLDRIPDDETINFDGKVFLLPAKLVSSQLDASTSLLERYRIIVAEIRRARTRAVVINLPTAGKS